MFGPGASGHPGPGLWFFPRTLGAPQVRFEDWRQQVLNGLVATGDSADVAAWNTYRDTIPLTAVVRTSDTEVTITLPAGAAFDLAAQITLTATLPAGVLALVRYAAITAAPTATVGAVRDLTATMAGAGSLTGGLTAQRSLGATMAGSGVIGTATLTRNRPLGPTMAGTGALASTLTRILPLTATLAGTGAMVAALTRRLDVAASMAGTGAIGTATLTRNLPTSATMAGSGTLSATLTRRRDLAGTMAGSGAFAATAIKARPMSATLAGSGTFTATAIKARPLAATMAGTGTLSAAPTYDLASLILRGLVSAQAEATGWNALVSSIPRSAVVRTSATRVTITLPALATYDLTADETITATISAHALALSTTPVVAAPTATITFVPATVTHDLSATMAGSGTLAATATRRRPLAPTFAGTGAFTASAARTRTLSATLAGAGTLVVAGVTIHALTATLAGVGALGAVLSGVIRDLTATVAGSGAVTSTLGRNRALSSTLAGTGTLTAGLTRRRPLAPTMAGSGVLTGALEALTGFYAKARALLDGLVSAQSEATGWNALRSSIPTTAVVRTGDVQATITLPPLPTYDLTANETITATIPASILAGGQAVVAVPSVTVSEAPAGSIRATFAGTGALSATLTVKGDSTLAWEVRQSGALIATRAWVPMTAPVGDPSCPAERYFFELTAEEAALVTDWSAVQVWLTADGGLRAIRVMRLKVDVPMIVTQSLTAAMAGSGTLTASLTRVRSSTGTMAGTGTLATTLRRVRALAPTLAGLGTFTSLLVRRRDLVVPTLAGAGALGVGLTRTRPVVASMAGSGTLTAAITPVRADTGVMAGFGALSATLRAVRRLVASLVGSGAVEAVVTPQRALAATMDGVGALIMDPPFIRRPLVAEMAGSGTFAADLGIVVRPPIDLTAEVSGSGDLTATLSRIVLLTAPFAGEGRLVVEGPGQVIGLAAIFRGVGRLLVTAPVALVRLVDVWMAASSLIHVKIDADLPDDDGLDGSRLINVQMIDPAVAAASGDSELTRVLMVSP